MENFAPVNEFLRNIITFTQREDYELDTNLDRTTLTTHLANSDQYITVHYLENFSHIAISASCEYAYKHTELKFEDVSSMKELVEVKHKVIEWLNQIVLAYERLIDNGNAAIDKLEQLDMTDTLKNAVKSGVTRILDIANADAQDPDTLNSTQYSAEFKTVGDDFVIVITKAEKNGTVAYKRFAVRRYLDLDRISMNHVVAFSTSDRTIDMIDLYESENGCENRVIDEIAQSVMIEMNR